MDNQGRRKQEYTHQENSQSSESVSTPHQRKLGNEDGNDICHDFLLRKIGRPNKSMG